MNVDKVRWCCERLCKTFLDVYDPDVNPPQTLFNFLVFRLILPDDFMKKQAKFYK